MGLKTKSFNLTRKGFLEHVVRGALTEQQLEAQRVARRQKREQPTTSTEKEKVNE